MDKTKITKLWTPPEVEHVKKLAAQGMSAAEIAAEVGRTRNSVIGAIHRNKVQLLSRQNPKPKVERPPRPPRPRRGEHLKRVFLSNPNTKEVKHVSPPPPANKENYVPFLKRNNNQCKYIVEKRGETNYCCGNPVDRKGWCEYHASIVYRPPDPKPVKSDGGNGVHPALRSITK